METIKIDSLHDLEKKLIKESSVLTLGTESPEKSQEFYIFRGVPLPPAQLNSSLERYLAEKWGQVWKDQIRNFEQKLLNRFIDEILPKQRALNSQYS